MFVLRLLRQDDPTGRVLDERPFDGGSMTIGRGSGADWVIQDPVRLLSKRHCELRRQGDSALLIDLSSNGVYLNGSSQRMTPGEAAPVRVGDQIRLGDYLVRFDAPVAHRGFEPRAPLPDNPFRSPLTMPGLPPPRTLPPRGSSETGFGGLTGAVDPLKAAEKPISALSALKWEDDRRSGETGALARPRGVAQAFERPMRAPDALDPADWRIPENWSDWEEPAAEDASPVALPDPVAVDVPEPPPPLPTSGDAAGLAAFLRGAQLKPADFADADAEAVLEAAGQAYRAAVLGMSEVLRDRAFVKNQFRIAQTMMVARGANPLRMFDPPEAGVLLLKSQIAGFLSAGPAFTAACQDIKKHQLATLAGLRAAVRAAIAALDPGQGPEAEAGGWFKGLRQGRSAQAALDALKDSFVRFREEADDNPDSLINREFRRGYEACLEQISRSETGEA